jgi:nitrogen fixation protein NifU and related proteins
MEAYNDTVIDHFQNPRNAGVLDDANAIGFTSNPVCGDAMRLMLRIEDDLIAEARFQTSGCPAAIATSSFTTEMITGKRIAEVEGLTREEISQAIGGLPASKVHCSVLASDCLKKAIAAYRSS